MPVVIKYRMLTVVMESIRFMSKMMMMMMMMIDMLTSAYAGCFLSPVLLFIFESSIFMAVQVLAKNLKISGLNLRVLGLLDFKYCGKISIAVWIVKMHHLSPESQASSGCWNYKCFAAKKNFLDMKDQIMGFHP